MVTCSSLTLKDILDNVIKPPQGTVLSKFGAIEEIIIKILPWLQEQHIINFKISPTHPNTDLQKNYSYTFWNKQNNDAMMCTEKCKTFFCLRHFVYLCVSTPGCSHD